MKISHVYNKFKVPLNKEEMCYYQDIINSPDNGEHSIDGKIIGYDEECICDDVARRVGVLPEGYGMFDAKIIHEDGIYYATWKCYSNCD